MAGNDSIITAEGPIELDAGIEAGILLKEISDKEFLALRAGDLPNSRYVFDPYVMPDRVEYLNASIPFCAAVILKASRIVELRNGDVIQSTKLKGTFDPVNDVSIFIPYDQRNESNPTRQYEVESILYYALLAVGLKKTIKSN